MSTSAIFRSVGVKFGDAPGSESGEESVSGDSVLVADESGEETSEKAPVCEQERREEGSDGRMEDSAGAASARSSTRGSAMYSARSPKK